MGSGFKGVALALSMVVAGVFGCGGDEDEGGTASCVSLCQEAQAGRCTSIRGDCGAFCAALDRVAPPAGCSDEKAIYEECLNSKADVCAASCGRSENALQVCAAAYCQSRAADPDCQTLIGSF